MVDYRLTQCGRATNFSFTPVSRGTLTNHKSPTTIGELNDLRR